MVIWIGALVPTFLVSRLLLFLTRKIGVSGPLRIILSHTVSLGLVFLIAGIGFADGGNFAGGEAILAYAPPQLFWLMVDFGVARRRRSQTNPSPGEAG